MFAPRGVPKAVVDKINADVAKALAEQGARDRLATVGFEAWSATPAEVTKAIEADSRGFAEVVKRARISLD